MSKRKAHNPMKRLQMQADAILKDVALALVSSIGDGYSDAYKMTTLKPFPIGMQTAQFMKTCHFKWSFLLFIWAEERNGKRRLVTDFSRMASRYKEPDLVKFIGEAHREMALREEAKGNVVRDAGYVAVPVTSIEDDAELEAAMMRVMALHYKGDVV